MPIIEPEIIVFANTVNAYRSRPESSAHAIFANAKSRFIIHANSCDFIIMIQFPVP
ncbi:MAG: hypothetical protein U5L09_07120 [Bacteroidales bacterium]|nr:hypothetical protein [Bacteroidales bacterium]